MYYIKFFLLLCFIQTFSQEIDDKLIKIEYENIIVMEDDKSLSSSIPVYFELLSSVKESNFKKIDRVINSQSESYFFESDDGLLYKNFDNNKYLKEEELGNKKYLIKDYLPSLNWLKTSQDSLILDRKVFLATLEINEKFVKAWYFPTKINNGPYLYGGLPGIVLYLEEILLHKDEKNTKEKKIFKAISIKEINKKALIIPEEKKKVETVSNKEMKNLKKKYYDEQMDFFKSRKAVE